MMNMNFAKWNRDRLVRFAELMDGDGHSILCPFGVAENLDLGPAEAAHLGALSTVHYSHATEPKEMITSREGKPVSEMFGFYTLTIYRQMANDLKVEYEDKYGRGSEARSILRALRAHFIKEVTA